MDEGGSDLRARLARHRTLGGAPGEELAWLVAHGALRTYRVGEVTTRKGQPEEWLQILLAGHLAVHADRGAGARRLIGWRGGDVCGLLPYSRGGSPPGDTVAEEPSEMVAVHGDHHAEMIQKCPRVTALLVHAMLDRARYFTSSDMLDEKLVALGRLAAGLAHELNNPASAAARGTRLLGQALAEAEAAARALAGARLSDAQLESLDAVSVRCGPDPEGARRSTLERADREDAFAAWLEARGLDGASAIPLAGTGVTLGALDGLAAALPADALGAAVRSVAADGVIRSLTAEIETSVSRIHELVAAVKGFTYMDRAPTLESTDVRRGIEDTLVLLGAKAREKSVTIDMALAPDLPPVPAAGAELNQVWSNLIDNALDAAGSCGCVKIEAVRERERLVVRIVDDGPGIPPEIRGRIFEPFFTTKPVGQGLGLGLDAVRRVVQRHRGELDVESRPGRTEFSVSLPIDPDPANP
jgi:signal transduction histidine kinase